MAARDVFGTADGCCECDVNEESSRGESLEKIRERVRKLLRLATSSNVHEAATAAAFAQTLIARHRLQAILHEVPATETEVIVAYTDEPLDASKRLREWKIELAAVLAAANGCRIYVQHGPDKIDRLIAVGRRDDFDDLREFYEPMVRMVECLTRSHGEGRDRKWCEGFRLGVVATLRERLQQANVEVSSQALATDTALLGSTRAVMAAREAALAHWMQQHLSRAKPMRGPKVIVAAYDHGRLAGQDLTLTTPRKPKP